MLIDIPHDVALRLHDIAEERGCSAGEILREWVQREPAHQEHGILADMAPNDTATDSGEEPWPPPGSLAALAENARRANLGGGTATDTSARSREILWAEYPDYIRRRQRY